MAKLQSSLYLVVVLAILALHTRGAAAHGSKQLRIKRGHSDSRAVLSPVGGLVGDVLTTSNLAEEEPALLVPEALTNATSRMINISDSVNGVNASAYAAAVKKSITQERADELNATSAPSPPPYSASVGVASPMVAPVVEMTGSLQTEMDSARELAKKDCLVTDWSEWGLCEASSDGGLARELVQRRAREIVQPQLPGGSACVPLSEAAPCRPEGALGSSSGDLGSSSDFDTAYSEPVSSVILLSVGTSVRQVDPCADRSDELGLLEGGTEPVCAAATTKLERVKR